jgi:hypothetical protein
MYGRPGAPAAQIAPGGSFQAQANAGKRYGSAAQASGPAKWFPVWLAIGLALYFVWAVLEQHERIRSAVKPQNIGVNLRNLAVILVTVVLGLNLLKILAAKLCAWGVPGADTVVMLVGGA